MMVEKGSRCKSGTVTFTVMWTRKQNFYVHKMTHLLFHAHESCHWCVSYIPRRRFCGWSEVRKPAAAVVSSFLGWRNSLVFISLQILQIPLYLDIGTCVNMCKKQFSWLETAFFYMNHYWESYPIVVFRVYMKWRDNIKIWLLDWIFI